MVQTSRASFSIESGCKTTWNRYKVTAETKIFLRILGDYFLNCSSDFIKYQLYLRYLLRCATFRRLETLINITRNMGNESTSISYVYFIFTDILVEPHSRRITVCK
jgi:hypothetical protein